MAGIAVFGGANMDILGYPQGELRLRDSNIGRVLLRPGGVGRNIAAQIAMRGHACTLLTAFGTDDMAAVLRRSCMDAGVDISAALTAEGATCTYLCVHDETGDMLAAVNDMALAAALTPEYAAAALPVIDRSDLCVLDANPPVETVRYLAEHVAAPLLFDPVSCAKLDRAQGILPHLAAAKPNLLEAQALTGQTGPLECAKALVHAGVRRAFVSLGAAGLCCADADCCTVLPVEKLSASGKTGAGDALCAGLAIALAAGESTLECAKYGLHCAAEFLNQVEGQ